MRKFGVWRSGYPDITNRTLLLVPRRQFESTYKSCLKKLTGELLDFAREDFQTIWNWLFDTSLISKDICSPIPERHSVKSVLCSQPSPVESLESFFRFLFTLWKINEFSLQRLQIPQMPCCRILINCYFYTESAQVSGTWGHLQDLFFYYWLCALCSISFRVSLVLWRVKLIEVSFSAPCYYEVCESNFKRSPDFQREAFSVLSSHIYFCLS